MTRNQKIALGCGGAGCLGLIVVVIAGVLIYFFAYNRPYSTNRNDDDNFNVTTNGNSNLNSNDNSNTNDNDNSSSNSNASNGSAASMSDDDKHKLYQAAMMTGDSELLRRVSVKIGLMDDDYTPGADYSSFVASHVTWAIRNGEFIRSLDTPAKARDYVDQNIPN